MMRYVARAALSHFIILLRWIVLSCIVGLLVGAVSVGFHYGVEAATELRMSHPWMLWFLPVGGIVIVLLYKACGIEEDRGTNLVLVAVRENEPMALRTAPLIILSTIITHLFGGSSGREGAVLQIGASIASRLGRRVKLSEHTCRILVVCGMSAAFSALFGTPITAAIFAMEVVHVGVIHYSAIVPSLLSALVGLQVAQWFQVAPAAFAVSGVPVLEPLSLVKIIGMGILFAILSILFYQTMHLSAHLYQKYMKKPFLRAAAGGGLVILVTLLSGSYDYNGVGMGVIKAAVSGTARPEAFAFKILLTALTLGAGFKGGEIIPAFFAGATFGCVAGPFLGLPASFSAALGMVSVFCGVTNCPITSIILAYELFGGAGLPFFALSCAVSYMLSGYGGLYSEQKIVYSKLKPVPREEQERSLAS